MIALWIATADTAALTQPPKPIETKPFLTFQDYPEDAIADGDYGRVSLYLQIGADGRVSNCAVTETSGARSLDDMACAAAKKRARFEPARDAAGESVAGDYRTGVVFGLGEHQLLSVIPMTLGVKALPSDYDTPAKTRVLFGPDGRVENCAVMTSSGSAGADAAICTVVQRDLRIAPPKSGSREPAAAVRFYAVRLTTSK